jgi:hypothetical protein
MVWLLVTNAKFGSAWLAGMHSRARSTCATQHCHVYSKQYSAYAEVYQPDPPGLIHDDPRLLPPWRGSSLILGKFLPPLRPAMPGADSVSFVHRSGVVHRSLFAAGGKRLHPGTVGK